MYTGPPARLRCSRARWPWSPTIRSATWTRARHRSRRHRDPGRSLPGRAARDGRCASGLARRAARGAQLLVLRRFAAVVRGLLDAAGLPSAGRGSGLERGARTVDSVRASATLQDGRITTTAGVTSGVFRRLRLRPAARQRRRGAAVGRELGLPASSGRPRRRPRAAAEAAPDLADLIAALAPWRRRSASGFVEGASGIDIAAPFRSTPARSPPHGADRRWARRHHPLRAALVAAPACATVSRIERLIAPGPPPADQVDPRLAASSGRASRSTSNSRRRTASPARRDPRRRLARHADPATASIAADAIDTPTQARLHCAARRGRGKHHHPGPPSPWQRPWHGFLPGGRRPPEPAMTPIPAPTPTRCRSSRYMYRSYQDSHRRMQATDHQLALRWLDQAVDPASPASPGCAAVSSGTLWQPEHPGRSPISTTIARTFVLLAAAGVTGPAWLLVLATRAMVSRTSGRSAAATLPGHGGGRRSAPPSTGSSPWFSPSRSLQEPDFITSQATGQRQSRVDFETGT